MDLSSRAKRKALVQMLYAHCVEQCWSVRYHAVDSCVFFEEDDIRRLEVMRSKAIIHALQGIEMRGEKVIKAAQEKRLITGGSQVASLVAVHEGLANYLSRLLINLRGVQKQIKQSSTAIVFLKKFNEAILEYAKRLEELCFSWENGILALPEQWVYRLEDQTASVVKIKRAMQALSKLAAYDVEEYGAIVRLKARIEQFEREMHERLACVLSHAPELNQQLDAVIKNFKSERVSPVDRAILLVGLYELKFCPALARGLVIHESIELARNLSGESATGFINGILDSFHFPESAHETPS